MFRRLGVYKGMLLSYLAITLVALSLVGSFMLWMIHSNLYAQYASRHLADFNRTMGILEDQFNACKTIAAQISYDEGLTYQVMTQNNYNTILGINSLRMYASGNAYLEDLALCFRDVDTVYSYRGTETLGTTAQYRIRTTKEEALDLSRTIQETTTVQYLLMAGGQKLAILIPIPLNSIENNGCALFLFDSKTIGRLCAMREEGAHMLVLRGDGTLLMDLYGGSAELRGEQLSGIQSALAHGKRGYAQDIVPGVDAVLGWGGVTGLSYAYLISPNNILREVADVMLLCLSIVGVAIGVCLVLAVWFSKRYFRPVQLLQSMLPTDVESASRDEFEHIRLTMAKTLRQKNIIADQYEAQRMYLMKAALSQLLERDNRSHADRALPSHLHKHLFQYPNFFTMFVSQPSVNWDMMPMDRAMAVAVPSDLEDMTLLVINFDAGDAPEDRRRALAEELIEILYMDARAGVSAWCSGVE
ncbi:MAG TPA: hypothetical protein PKE04_00485, partial [Clostridia bacterium]|nr:hypothetical protein [Clostridia bacterium]